MALLLDTARCVGCGLCVRACAYGALEKTGNGIAIDHEKCVLCASCVQSCPKNALSIERNGSAKADEAAGVWVFAERADTLLPVALELTGRARQLADKRGAYVTALLPCGTQEDADALIAAGADRIISCPSTYLQTRLDAPYTDWIAGLAKEQKPEILLFGATGFGRSLAPRVAARLGAGLTADCTGLDIDPETGLLLQTRPAFGGNLMATIMSPHHRPQMATVRPGVMPAPVPDAGRRGSVEQSSGPDSAGLVELLERQAKKAQDGIAQADVIVSAGRGIGPRKNLSLIQQLADRLGAQVGVTRPLVDMGWMGREHQIGQTGTAVAPRLLIAFGVSGAIQHLAGMGGAQTVVAVNTDPDAAIFSAADYRVVADAEEVLQALLQKLS